jgi:hypothetical protein
MATVAPPTLPEHGLLYADSSRGPTADAAPEARYEQREGALHRARLTPSGDPA